MSLFGYPAWWRRPGWGRRGHVRFWVGHPDRQNHHRLLVTGAAGLMGRLLRPLLRRPDWQVRLVDLVAITT